MVPAVVVITTDHPFVRVIAAFEPGDYVVGRHHVPVELGLHSDAGRPRSEVIGNWQVAPPFIGYDFPAHGAEQWQRVAVGDRQNRDPGDRRCFLASQAPCPRYRTLTRGQHIARISWHVHDGPALHAAFILERALRVYITPAVAIVGRVGIDNRSYRTFFASQFRFDAPPGTSVLGNCDLAGNIDAVALQHFVVFRDTVVDKDEFSFDFAVAGKRVVGWQQAVGHRRARVAGYGVLGQPCGVLHWRNKLDFPHPRGRQEYLVVRNLDIIAP